MSSLVRASVVDRAVSGARVVIVVGPLRLRDPEAINETCARLAAKGPLNRFGLHPVTSRDWTFDPASPTAWSVVRDADAFEAADTDAEIGRRLKDQSRDVLSIRLRGDYALIEYSHGVCDAPFAFALMAMLSGDEAGQLENWPPSTTNRPLRDAWRHVMAHRRQHLISGVAGLLEQRRNAHAENPAATSQRLSVAPAFVSARSDPGYDAGLRRAIRESKPAGVLASIIAATANALRKRGIDSLPTAGVAVDLRRYLPSDCHTLSNFMSLVEVPTTEGTRGHEIHSALQAEMTSYRPFLLFGLASMTRRVSEWCAWDVESADRARLTFSDLRSVPGVERFAWHPSSGEPQLAISLPLHYRDQVAISITALPQGRIQLSATFYDSAFDAAVLRGALSDVLADPHAAAAPG